MFSHFPVFYVLKCYPLIFHFTIIYAFINIPRLLFLPYFVCFCRCHNWRLVINVAVIADIVITVIIFAILTILDQTVSKGDQIHHWSNCPLLQQRTSACFLWKRLHEVLSSSSLVYFFFFFFFLLDNYLKLS